MPPAFTALRSTFDKKTKRHMISCQCIHYTHIYRTHCRTQKGRAMERHVSKEMLIKSTDTQTKRLILTSPTHLCPRRHVTWLPFTLRL